MQRKDYFNNNNYNKTDRTVRVHQQNELYYNSNPKSASESIEKRHMTMNIYEWLSFDNNSESQSKGTNVSRSAAPAAQVDIQQPIL